MAQVKMFGPGGDPDAHSAPQEVTLVPWDDIKPKLGHEHEPSYDKDQTLHAREPSGNITSSTVMEPRIPQAWTFADQNAVLSESPSSVI